MLRGVEVTLPGGGGQRRRKEGRRKGQGGKRKGGDGGGGEKGGKGKGGSFRRSATSSVNLHAVKREVGCGVPRGAAESRGLERGGDSP